MRLSTEQIEEKIKIYSEMDISDLEFSRMENHSEKFGKFQPPMKYNLWLDCHIDGTFSTMFISMLDYRSDTAVENNQFETLDDALLFVRMNYL